MITTYQIRNVLRVYGNQLKERTLPVKDSIIPPKYSSDIVNISTVARRKQMFNGISDDIISKIRQNDHQQVAKGKEPLNFPTITEQENNENEN